MRKDTTVSLRIPTELRDQLEQSAADDCRTMGAQALHYIKLGLGAPKTRPKPKSEISCPHDVTTQVWQDFMEVRKAKKSPITESAISQLRSEADKAGWSLNEAVMECCSRGWAGFKAEWVNKANKQQVLENTNRQAAEAFING